MPAASRFLFSVHGAGVHSLRIIRAYLPETFTVTVELKMPRRSDACNACGHPFAVGESLLAWLFDTPHGYERRDLCIACAAAQPVTRMSTQTTPARTVRASHVQASGRAARGRLTMRAVSPAWVSSSWPRWTRNPDPTPRTSRSASSNRFATRCVTCAPSKWRPTSGSTACAGT